MKTVPSAVKALRKQYWRRTTMVSDENQYDRRTLLKAAAGGLAGNLVASELLAAAGPQSGKINGTVKQSVCKWCYNDMTVEQLEREAAHIGLRSVELLTPEEWPVLKKSGLTCAMGSGAGPIEVGLNRKENHDRWVTNLR